MEVKPALSLPDGLELVAFEKMDEILTITVVSTQESPCCPCCGQAARRVHSRYTRQAADLPCGGQRLRMVLHVQKFFCNVKACARKIFTERLAPFVEPLARVTTRLSESVQVIGFATGGMLGARLTDRLEIQACWMTILRRMMARPTAPVAQVVELGIDDFAFHRSQSFVQGVERDKAAVVAGLTLSQNNGLVEGKVNKLKLIKRMGYGRAGFPLLRQRVLHAL